MIIDHCTKAFGFPYHQNQFSKKEKVCRIERLYLIIVFHIGRRFIQLFSAHSEKQLGLQNSCQCSCLQQGYQKSCIDSLFGNIVKNVSCSPRISSDTIKIIYNTLKYQEIKPSSNYLKHFFLVSPPISLWGVLLTQLSAHLHKQSTCYNSSTNLKSSQRVLLCLIKESLGRC